MRSGFSRPFGLDARKQDERLGVSPACVGRPCETRCVERIR
jgi:hypothetical protein